jgi:hypothetical protein
MDHYGGIARSLLKEHLVRVNGVAFAKTALRCLAHLTLSFNDFILLLFISASGSITCQT